MATTHIAGAIIQLKEEPSTDGVQTHTATQLEDPPHPSVDEKAAGGKKHALSWSFGPVKVQGSVDAQTETIGVKVVVFGITAANITGSLKTGVVVNLNLVAAKGTIRFFLKNKDEVWVDLKLTEEIDRKKYNKEEKILDI